MSEKSLVKNAADPDQVKEATNKERRQREQELNDIRHLLQTRQGRRFLWRMLSRCNCFSTIWEPSAKIHFNAGVQDVGFFLLGEITAANEDAFLLMMKEAKEEK